MNGLPIALGIHSSHALLITCLPFAERIYSSMDVIVGTLKSTQTFEKDPHLLLSDGEESVWRARMETKALEHTTSGFFGDVSRALCWNISCPVLKTKHSGLN